MMKTFLELKSNFVKLIFVSALFSLLFMGCEKSSFTPVKVTYKVKIVSGNKVNIRYYSDYYFETGIMEPVVFTGDGSTWQASRIAKSEEDYYIKVDYIDAPNVEDNFKVQVYFNDTSQVASAIKDSVVTPITLQGRVVN